MVLLWTCTTKGRLKLSPIQLHHKTNVGKLYYSKERQLTADGHCNAKWL